MQLDRLILRGEWRPKSERPDSRSGAWSAGFELLYDDFVGKRRRLVAVVGGGGGDDKEEDAGPSTLMGAAPSLVTPLTQVSLLLCLNAASLVTQLFSVPFVSRWVAVVEAATLAQESVAFLAVLAAELEWGWDTGAVMFNTALATSYIIIADTLLGQLQLVIMLASQKQAVVEGVAAVRAKARTLLDRVTGRADALVQPCREVRVAVDLEADPDLERWVARSSVRWTLSREHKGREAGRPFGQDLVNSYPFHSSESRYESALAALGDALAQAPASAPPDAPTRLRALLPADPDRDQDRRGGRPGPGPGPYGQLAGDLRLVAGAVRELRESPDPPKPPPPAAPPSSSSSEAEGEGEADAKKKEKEEEEVDKFASLTAAARLADDEALDACLTARGLCRNLADSSARRAELRRLERALKEAGEDEEEARERLEAAQAKAAAADAARARRLRLWRAVARALWRFGPTEHSASPRRHSTLDDRDSAAGAGAGTPSRSLPRVRSAASVAEPTPRPVSSTGTPPRARARGDDSLSSYSLAQRRLQLPYGGEFESAIERVDTVAQRRALSHSPSPSTSATAFGGPAGPGPSSSPPPPAPNVSAPAPSLRPRQLEPLFADDKGYLN
eukprot:tig00020902_g14971.t1